MAAADRVRSGEAKADIEYNYNLVRELHSADKRPQMYIDFFERLKEEKVLKKVRNESKVFDNHPNS